MSLETWKKEFYPVEAVDLAGSDDATCVKHCLKKWEGKLPHNLGRHGIADCHRAIYEPGDGRHNLFDFTADTCALCHKYRLGRGYNLICRGCPLAEADKPCDDEGSAFREGTEAMLKALRKALTLVEQPPPSLGLSLIDLQKFAKREGQAYFDLIDRDDSLESMCALDVLSVYATSDAGALTGVQTGKEIALPGEYHEMISRTLEPAQEACILVRAVLCKGLFLAKAIDLLINDGVEPASKYLKSNCKFLFGMEPK